LLGDLSADVRCVQFDGTGRGPSPVGLLLGYTERRVVGGAWCFYLRLWGVPERAVSERRAELARAALGAIRQSVVECLARRPAEVVKPTQFLLRFHIEAEGVVDKCSVKPVDRYSFAAGRWWECPSPAAPVAAEGTMKVKGRRR
jgi:hypothetical protein